MVSFYTQLVEAPSRPAEVVGFAHNVILTEVVAGLDLDDFEGFDG